jgi:hypothetical protein
MLEVRFGGREEGEDEEIEEKTMENIDVAKDK